MLGARAVAFDADEVADAIEHKHRRNVPPQTGLFDPRIANHYHDCLALCSSLPSGVQPTRAEYSGEGASYSRGAFAPHISLGPLGETMRALSEMILRLPLWVLLLAVIALCSVQAQVEAAGPRIGFLSYGTPEPAATTLAGLRQGLREHGYVEGTNIAIESRFARGQFNRLPDLARELIRLPVDVLVTAFTPATIAGMDSTRTIPIVMVGVSDPVAAGLVASLARPGGNVTGTASMTADTAGKPLELLKEVVPGLRHVAVLWNPANRVYQTQLLRETEAAAQSLAVRIQLFEAYDPDSIERAFEVISKERPSALYIFTDQMFVATGTRIAALAKKARLPSVSGNSEIAEAGGLMTYGPNRFELGRAAGAYVAKILKGTKPAELPVEQPTKFELVINMKTANELGVKIPRSLQVRADRVLE